MALDSIRRKSSDGLYTEKPKINNEGFTFNHQKNNTKTYDTDVKIQEIEERLRNLKKVRENIINADLSSENIQKGLEEAMADALGELDGSKTKASMLEQARGNKFANFSNSSNTTTNLSSENIQKGLEEAMADALGELDGSKTKASMSEQAKENKSANNNPINPFSNNDELNEMLQYTETKSIQNEDTMNKK